MAASAVSVIDRRSRVVFVVMVLVLMVRPAGLFGKEL